jgi:predicted nuclease of predicted toxin-antitoxin system
MPEFIVDANLPYYFQLWNSERFVYVEDLNDEWTDEQIWEYAKNNNLIIITKDSDFSNRIIFHEPPPKVIHIKTGNLRMKELFILFEKNWNEIEKTINKFKLVNVYKNKIEGIN